MASVASAEADPCVHLPVHSNLEDSLQPDSLQPDSLQPDTHSLQPDSLQPDTHSLQPDSLQPESHSLQPDSHSLQPDSHSLQPDSHSLQPDSHSLQPDSLHHAEPEQPQADPPQQAEPPQQTASQQTASQQRPEAEALYLPPPLQMHDRADRRPPPSPRARRGNPDRFEALLDTCMHDVRTHQAPAPSSGPAVPRASMDDLHAFRSVNTATHTAMETNMANAFARLDENQAYRHVALFIRLLMEGIDLTHESYGPLTEGRVGAVASCISSVVHQALNARDASAPPLPTWAMVLIGALVVLLLGVGTALVIVCIKHFHSYALRVMILRVMIASWSVPLLGRAKPQHVMVAIRHGVGARRDVRLLRSRYDRPVRVDQLTRRAADELGLVWMRDHLSLGNPETEPVVGKTRGADQQHERKHNGDQRRDRHDDRHGVLPHVPEPALQPMDARG